VGGVAADYRGGGGFGDDGSGAARSEGYAGGLWGWVFWAEG